jgi:hypothetical protein
MRTFIAFLVLVGLAAAVDQIMLDGHYRAEVAQEAKYQAYLLNRQIMRLINRF